MRTRLLDFAELAFDGAFVGRVVAGLALCADSGGFRVTGGKWSGHREGPPGKV